MNTETALRELQSLLENNGLNNTEIATAFTDILKKMMTSSVNVGIVNELKSLGARIASDPRGVLADSINKIKGVLTNADLGSIPIKLGIQTNLSQLAAEAQEFLSGAGSNLKLGFDLVLNDKSSVMNSLQNLSQEIKDSPQYTKMFAGMNNQGDVFKDAAGAGLRTLLTEKMSDSFLGKGLENIDNTMSFSLNKYRDASIARTQEMSNPFGTETYEDNLKSFQGSTAVRQQLFGEDNEDALRKITDMTSAIDNIKAQLGQDFQIRFGEGTKEVVLDAASALSVFSEELGISQSQMSNYVNFLTTRFDGSSKNLEQNLLNIAKGAAAAGMPVKNFMNDISSINEQYKDLGDVTNVTSSMMAQFAQALGPNRLGLARDVIGQMTSGIANMSDEMKAFLTMGNELGGGGGALEGIINFEEAVASGDQEKIREIQQEALARIEELSGGGLLTRKEAVDSGQQELFFRQSALSEQMGLSRGRNQFSALVEGSRAGQVDLAGMAGGTDDLINRRIDNQQRSQTLVDTMRNTSLGIAESNMINPNIALDRMRLMGASSASDAIRGGLDFSSGDQINEMIKRAFTGAMPAKTATGIDAARSATEGAMQQHEDASTTYREGASGAFKNATGTYGAGARLEANQTSTTMVEGAIEASAVIRESLKTELTAPMLDTFAEITQSINTSNETQISKLDEQINAINELVKTLVDQKVQINLGPDASKMFDAIVSKKLKSSLG